MGAIGETGAVFAAPQRGNTMSHLHFRFFDSWVRGPVRPTFANKFKCVSLLHRTPRGGFATCPMARRSSRLPSDAATSPYVCSQGLSVVVRTYVHCCLRHGQVATSLRNLRIFTIGGTPVMTIATDGAVVTLACSETDQLAVVCHAGRGLPTEQSLNLELWDLENLQGESCPWSTCQRVNISLMICRK